MEAVIYRWCSSMGSRFGPALASTALLMGCFMWGSGCRTASELDPAAIDSASSNSLTNEVADAQAGYRLSRGDEVELHVYREPQISGTFRVDMTGAVRHPLCGPISVLGKTAIEAEEAFRALLAEKYLVNPRVTLTILSMQSSHIVVLGEVKRPGVHPIPQGGRMTILEGIAVAGGFSDLASPARVTVQRAKGDGDSIRVRVPRIIEGEDENVELFPNDVVMVPKIRF